MDPEVNSDGKADVLFVEVEKNTTSVNGSSGAIPFQSYQLGLHSWAVLVSSTPFPHNSTQKLLNKFQNQKSIFNLHRLSVSTYL